MDKYGNLIEDRQYNLRDFDRNMILERRTELVAAKISEFLRATNRFAKTIVFCETTGHAERNLMTAASRRFDPALLAGCTMVTSAEPCAMCAGAAYWSGIGRIVYGLSEKRLGELIGPHPEILTMDLPCRQVLAAGKRDIEVVGPALEDEAASGHAGFWG